MSSRQKVAIYKPMDWYNALAKQYSGFHKHLDSFDKSEFLRFLPRDYATRSFLELGAWDWRIYNLLPQKPQSFTACDIAGELLEKHPNWKNINKFLCNLEEDLPFGDEGFDIVLSFFVLEHIQNIENLFSELYRVLKNGWTVIIGHFLQRRSVIFQNGKTKYKIEQFQHSQEFLCNTANLFFDKVFAKPIYEKNTLIWHFIVLSK